MNSKFKQRHLRSASGQGIALCALAMLILGMGVVLGALFLFNAGIAYYYQDKLTFVAQQAANDAAAQDPYTAQTNAQIFAEDLSQLIFPAINPHDVQATVYVQGDAYSVQMSAKLPLLTGPLASVFGKSATINTGSILSTEKTQAGPLWYRNPDAYLGVPCASAPQASSGLTDPQGEPICLVPAVVAPSRGLAGKAFLQGAQIYQAKAWKATEQINQPSTGK